jgi:hypothetical protein
MSNLLPSDTRYNDYVTLFSTSKDDRVKKWLHEMYKINSSNQNVCNDLKKIDDTSVFISEYENINTSSEPILIYQP